MRLLVTLARPFAIATGIFALCNLTLTLLSPRLAATEIWLNIHVPEPIPALLVGLLGIALLAPHSAGERESVRVLLGGVFAGFGMLAISSTAGYYHRLATGEFQTSMPIPLSLFLTAVLAAEFVRVWRWKPSLSRAPASARVFVQSLAVVVATLSLTLGHLVSYGHTDFRRPADAAVIFGAKVNPDGTPCAALKDRLEAGIELYHQGLVDYLVMTGGVDAHGTSEPRIMADFAILSGVPAGKIILDEGGYNTRASAANCTEIAAIWGFESFLAVTQYFHCARVQLLFRRQGVECYTVPTSSLDRSGIRRASRLSRESYFLLREAIAFPFYFVAASVDERV